MKAFNISPLDPRVREVQANTKCSLQQAMYEVTIEEIKSFLIKGGDTRTVMFGLVNLVQQLILTRQE